MTTRRGFITGLISFAVTAPAIVRATSLMPVKVMVEPIKWPLYNEASTITLSEFSSMRSIDWKFPNPQWRVVHDVRDLWKLQNDVMDDIPYLTSM